MEYPIFLILALGLILFFGQSVQAAPSQDDLAKFGEMEKAIMDLTHSILAMSEGTAGLGSNDVLGSLSGSHGVPEDLQA